MIDFKSSLNDKQYEAVTTDGQFVRIIAGAGSGKTRVLTYRIAYLLSELQVHPTSILAITFTNKVAKEMRERAKKIVPNVSESLKIMTYHSLGARFLRKEIRVLNYPLSFTILDDDDQLKLIKNIAVEKGYRKGDDIVQLAMRYIGNKKTYGEMPSDIKIDEERFPNERLCLEFYEAYEKKLTAMSTLDFDDLILKTIEILKRFPDIRTRWQQSIAHILIDEFQDTNDVQYDLVKLLMRQGTCLYVVGDPDQTIYTWRGANQQIILDMDKKYETETIILNRNYRSSKNILNVANLLIAKNKARVKKDLFSENAQGVEVLAYRGQRNTDEAEWVLSRIRKLQATHADFKYHDVAVLYRANYLTLPFEKEFNRMNIPYRIFGGIRFYQRKEIKDVLAYFRLLSNKKDDISFLRIINVPRRGIGDVTVEQLQKEANQQGLSLYDYVEHINEFDTELKTKTIVSLDFMLKVIEKYRIKITENLEAFSEILRNYIIELGYYDELKEEDEEGRLENVDALFDDVLRYVNDNPASGFENYLENVALTSAQDDVQDGDFISMMTIHTAKGLEFKHVFVIGLNQGIFPSVRTLNEDAFLGMEEERRLCYVALTRAQESLCLSCSGDYSYTLQTTMIPSQFFEEAGVRFIKASDSYERGSMQHTFVDLFKDDTQKVTIQTNNISDWKVGDGVAHDAFGLGVVITIIDTEIIEVMFDTLGKKKLIANHPKLKRRNKEEGLE
jgi:DNA helicase II / ATP-dependent DNA helicase PcrA